jgi:serine protease Do
MNREINDNMNNDSSDDHLHHEDDYQFMSEVHKRRNLNGRQIVLIICGVCVLAILFGVIAGAVFSAVTAGYSKRHPDPVRMNANADSEAISETKSMESSSASSSVSQNAAASSVSENSAADPAQEDGERSLVNYEALNDQMKTIGNSAQKSIVYVMGIRNTEDWLNNTDTNTVTRSGLVVADANDRLLILTDYDGIDGAQKLAVELPDNSIVSAELVKRDPITNLAVIAVEKSGLNASEKSCYAVAALGNSYNIQIGDSVIAIGSPLGYSDSVVYGEVTSVENAVSVTDGEHNLIITNIMGSSSGNGFLVNTDGEFIGMIFQKYASQNSSAIVGIPGMLLKQLTEELCNNEPISYIGIQGQTVTESVSESSGISAGVYVTEIEANSPALSAGLAAGDIITEMDGHTITNMRLVHNIIASMKPGDTIPVTVRRKGASRYVKFKFELTVGECK